MLGWGLRRTTCLLVVAFVAATILVPPATPAAAEECATLLGCGDDLAWAVDLEDKIADNMWDGQVYEINYASGLPRERENITSVHGFGDSALWTGTYLASQSFRYALAKHYLAQRALPGGQRLFWMREKAEAKARVDQMVAKYNVLVNISKLWKHEFQPSTTQAGFGGGVIDGEPGYLMRACVDASLPEAYRWNNAQLGSDPKGMPRPYTADRRIFGPFEWTADGKTTTYFCEDGTSRDAYAGATFGMQTAFDLVAVDDRKMRGRLRDDLVTLSNFAFKYLWNTPRPHGRISIPIGSNYASSPCKEINAALPVCGHDFENFVSPLFVITPMARMNMTVGAYHVTQALPGHPDTQKWQAILAEEVATQGPVLAFSMEFDSTQPYAGYYKHNLSHLIGYDITMRAPNQALRTLFSQAVGAMDNSTGDDINAHFEAITFAITGESSRRDDAVTHLRQWRDYRTRIDTGVPTDNKANCGTQIECVPEDQYDIISPGGTEPVTVPGASKNLRARGPLQVAQRPPTDFLWQRPPTQLNGSASALHQAPGIDYLLPYWMLRYHTEVAVPTLQPFPAWPGPKHN